MTNVPLVRTLEERGKERERERGGGGGNYQRTKGTLISNAVVHELFTSIRESDSDVTSTDAALSHLI